MQFNDLSEQWEIIKDDVMPRWESIMKKSCFINGPDVEIFENNFSDYIGTRYACGTSNGTDAIKLCVEALELRGSVGVFIPANTFIATILGVEMAFGHDNPNIEYHLVDCDQFYQMDLTILERMLNGFRSRWDHCIILPVHLYGNCVDMVQVMSLSEKHNCYVIEDCSQAHGTTLMNGRRVGSFGHMSAFSLYPGKNLGCAGDGGVITTNDKDFFESLKLLQNWGAKEKYYYDRKGYNNRLDTLQAVIVDEKLKHLDEWNSKRNQVAGWYDQTIDSDLYVTPEKSPSCKTHTYHIYNVRTHKRDMVIKSLEEKNLPYGIHYPVPIELTEVYKNQFDLNLKTVGYCGQLLSLPMHPFLSQEEVEVVSGVLNHAL